MLRPHKVELGVACGAQEVLDLQVEDLLVLFLGHSAQLFVVVEESCGSWQDLGLIDSPGLTEAVHDAILLIQNVDGSLMSHVV